MDIYLKWESVWYGGYEEARKDGNGLDKVGLGGGWAWVGSKSEILQFLYKNGN